MEERYGAIGEGVCVDVDVGGAQGGVDEMVEGDVREDGRWFEG